jgi:hypothetical protein
MDLPDTARVQVVTFSLHTMQIVHLLDLILFGIFKHEIKSHLPFGDLETTVSFVYNVYMKMAKTLSLPNVWVAFSAIGVEFDKGIVPCRVVLSFSRKS